MYDKHTQDSITNYNKIAKDYDNTFDGQFTRELKECIVNKTTIPQNSKVLDVACGNGVLLNMINNKQKIEGYGIDISNAMIYEAKTKNPTFSLSVSNSSNLVFDDNYFDIVTVCAAFHHFSEPRQFLNEALRVLKSNGQLVVMEPYFPFVIRHVSNLLIPFIKMGDVKIYSKKELIRMLEDTGFSKVQYSKETKHGCMILGRKT